MIIRPKRLSNKKERAEVKRMRRRKKIKRARSQRSSLTT